MALSSETLSGGEVSIPVTPDTSKFGSQTESGIRGSLSSHVGGFTSIGKTIGLTIGAAAAAAVVGATVAVIHTGFQEAMDASAGLAQLRAGIASTGNAANVTSGGLENMASSLQGMTGQTDDSIVKAEQLLLTFTSIKNVGADKIFDDATRAATDMAAKFGGDASSQAILLGKALNDPVKGITALTRVGVSFTQGQKDTIKAMVDTGNTIGAQKVILAELTKEFGGAGIAAGKSLPGQMAIAKRSFEDFSQGIVETFIPVVLPVLQKVVKAFKDNAPAIQAVATAVAGGLKKAFADATPVVRDLGNFLHDIVGPALGKLLDWIGRTPQAFEAAAVAVAVLSAAAFVLDVALDANPIGAVVLALEGLIAVGIAVATNFGGITDGLIDFGTGLEHFFISVMQNVAGLAQGVINNVINVVNAIYGLINPLLALFHIPLIPKIGPVDFTSGFANLQNIISNGAGAAHVGLQSGPATGSGGAATKGPQALGDGGTVLPTPGGRIVRVAERGRAETVVDTATLQAAMAGNRGFTNNQYIYTSDPMVAANQGANQLKSRLAVAR